MAPDPYKYFRIEARELLDGLTEGVLELEKGNAEHDRISSMLRLAHTLKGAARVVKQRGSFSGNWLQIIFEFEDSALGKRVATSQSFARYRRAMDGVRFDT